MAWPFANGCDRRVLRHDHDYERLSADGIPYFVDGLGGETITGFGSTTRTASSATPATMAR